MAIYLSTDPVVCVFFMGHCEVCRCTGICSGVHPTQTGIDHTHHDRVFPVNWNERERMTSAVSERDVMIDAYFIAAIWRLLLAKIALRLKGPETQLALMNAVYLGAAQPREQILDAGQGAEGEKRRPLPQTTLGGEECDFQPEAS